MKRVIIGAILALPLLAAAIPTQQASASVVRNLPHVQAVASKPTLIALRHRVRIAGHYEGRGRYRQWIPAHYVYR